MQKVNCRKYADEILQRVQQEKKKPLWIMRTAKGDAAADAYINGIKKDCDRCGIRRWKETEPNRKFDKALNWLFLKNKLPCGGVVCDTPGEEPPFLNIDKYRDGKFLPCVVEAVLHIIEMEVGSIRGKRVLLIGRSEAIGKPLLAELVKRNATVTLAHSFTKNLESPNYLTTHDIIITAAGKAKLIDLNKCFADLVVDVGISKDENGKVCGDCFNFDPDDNDSMKVATLPGGVGLITRALLLDRIKNER